MNEKSILCRYLAEHRDWEAKLADDYGLSIRKKGPYAIFNYGPESHFELPIVQEARGIILDTERLEVVCWPFRKFGNFSESYADDIDWKTARVQEKVDGSIIKLWYSAREERWVFSTNSVIDAKEAEAGTYSKTTFLELIKCAVNYRKLDFSSLDHEKTYIFELVSPLTQVVVYYSAAKLWHLGTRSNITGEELCEDIGIEKPAEYPLGSLEECIEAARKLNAASKEQVLHEGFVVVDANWHRVKIKSPDYLVRHALSQVCLTPSNCMKLLWEEGRDPKWLCEMRPRDAAIIKYYDWQIEELCVKADRIAELARAMYAEYSGERAAVARMIGNDPLAVVGFKALESDEKGRDLLRRVRMARLIQLIRPYTPE